MTLAEAVEVISRNAGLPSHYLLKNAQIAQAGIEVAVHEVNPLSRRMRIPVGLPEEQQDAWIHAHVADWPNVQEAVKVLHDYWGHPEPVTRT